MFRTPTDELAESVRFYNDEYVQGETTSLPDDATLKRLCASDFEDSELSRAHVIGLLKQLGVREGAKLFDFGCSRGYGSYQLMRAGYDTTSFEISRPRARFAREKLGVRTIDEFDSWSSAPSQAGAFDVFFSSHVLEHVPSPTAAIGKARALLKPGGLFIAFFPNGSAGYRASDRNWSKLWGEVHPNFLDDVFINGVLGDMRRLIATSPVSLQSHDAAWLCGEGLPAARYLDSLRRYEMFVAASNPRS